MSIKQTRETCRQQTGRFVPATSKNQNLCAQPTLMALGKVTYVSFDFCSKDSLCVITINQDHSTLDFITEYYALKKKLTDIYDTASRIVVKTTPRYRTEAEPAAIMRCVHEGDLTFSARWVWNDRGAVVLTTAADTTIGLLLSYFSPEVAKAMEASGL